MKTQETLNIAEYAGECLRYRITVLPRDDAPISLSVFCNKFFPKLFLHSEFPKLESKIFSSNCYNKRIRMDTTSPAKKQSMFIIELLVK